MPCLATALQLVELSQLSLLGMFIAVSSSRMNSVVQMHFKHSDPTQCLRTLHLCKQLLYMTINLNLCSSNYLLLNTIGDTMYEKSYDSYLVHLVQRQVSSAL